ncbi:MAG: CapA family protein [Clostridia bacterium]|nr:CapA family protein [Clostridia bacterium]
MRVRLKLLPAIAVMLLVFFVSCSSEQGDKEIIDTSLRISVPAIEETVAPIETELTVTEAEVGTVPVQETELPETTDAPEPTPITEVRLSFAAAGDNVIHPNIYMEAARRAVEGGRAYNFKPIYEDVAELISQADIAFINQETLTAGESYGYSGYPRFNSPQDLAYDLIELGFDIVNIANNHMADKGTQGLADTITFWKSLPVMMIGGYDNAEDYDNVRIYEEQGITIAMLSYTYGTNGLSISSSSPIKIPYIKDEDIIRQVALAKEAADLVFVSVHWGEENWFKPTEEQRRVANLMAEQGVDVIIGHHPHVLQPIEWIERPDGERTLCIYSLGNIISTMMQGQNMVGGFMTFDIVKNEDGAHIENPIFIPTVFFYGKNYFSTHIYYMKDFNEDLAAIHGTQVYGYLDTYEELISYVEKNIAEDFLPEIYTSYQGE